MTLRVSSRTLEQLEWPQVVERLSGHARTPGARARCRSGGDQADAARLFADTLEEVRQRLAETSEARARLDRGDAPPLGGLPELGPVLRRLAKGGVLSAGDLLDLGATLAALSDTETYLRQRRDVAPRLASLAESIVPQRELAREIEACIDPEGEVRDSASGALAEARQEARRLGAELQERLSRLLRDPQIAPSLSDAYYTVRNDRYVLPVRADARGRVRGIVHDASASGTTLFIEPEAVVEVNNRLKQAELEAEREVRRILRSLSEEAAEACPTLERDLAALEAVDLAFARAHLSREMEAVEPEVARDGVFALQQLRHPLLPPGRVVPNDLRLGDGFSVLVLSGPNAGGKTVAMKAVALCALFVRAGLHVPAAPGARVACVDALLSDIGDAQSLRDSLSTFSAHMASLAQIVAAADARSLVVLDEIGDGTDPGEGAALAQSVLEALADSGAGVIATTHFNLLKEMAEVDSRFANASVEFEPETLEPTYRLRMGVAGVSSATAVAARMGLRPDVVSRAGALLRREDRRLDRMLAELSTSRSALESERREALRLRAESEQARAEYREKLERLSARRDKLLQAMRADLDTAFQDAHRQVAEVIRELQRGGSARDAARARDRLQALERHPETARAATAEPAAPPVALVDWARTRPGDAVRVPGGALGVVLAVPDRQGRAVVRVGAARLLVAADRLAAAPDERPGARTASRGASDVSGISGISVQLTEGVRPAELDVSLRCDVRGLRVPAALDRVATTLDRAATAGQPTVLFVHGLGTGALRDAIREHLADSPYVSRFTPGAPEEGGDGVTLAQLAE